MKKISRLPAHEEPLMAQAVADAVGATKRQIQLWTDGGAIRCLPETDRQGRGRQRLYEQSELPFAALVAHIERIRSVQTAREEDGCGPASALLTNMWLPVCQTDQSVGPGWEMCVSPMFKPTF